MLRLSSPLLRQAVRASGSSTMAARGDSFAKCEDPKGCPGRKLDTPAANWNSQPRHKGTGPPPLGKQWQTGRACSRWTQRGNVDRTASPGETGSVLVVAMMPVMVMMLAHAGVGVHHLRIVLRRLDHRRLRGLGGRGGSLGRRSLRVGSVGGGCGQGRRG